METFKSRALGPAFLLFMSLLTIDMNYREYNDNYNDVVTNTMKYYIVSNSTIYVLPLVDKLVN